MEATEAQALLRLQEIDLKLLRLASTLAAMPQQKKLKAADEARGRVVVEYKKIVGRREKTEEYYAGIESNLQYYRDKAEEVRTDAIERQEGYRHIQDLEDQLTSLAKKAEKCEHEMGQIRQDLERIRLAERNAEATLEKIDRQRDALQASFDEDSRLIRREIVELTQERAGVAELISDGLMARYDEARKRFKGLAVEELRGNVPSVCRVKLQAAAYHDLTHGPEVAECPYCHRILIVRGPLYEEEA